MNDMMNLMKKYWWVILVFLAFFFPQGTKQKFYRKANKARKASQRMAWQGYYGTKDAYKKQTRARRNKMTPKRKLAMEKAYLKKMAKMRAASLKRERAIKRRQSRTGLKY